MTSRAVLLAEPYALRVDEHRTKLEAAERWPPPPHDPRERELVMVLTGWEVRLFSGPKFQYFAPRGFWHVQLWHPEARVSVLTPSRLTSGFYEAYPIANWKAQASDYDRLVSLIAGTHSASLPRKAEIVRIEKAFVNDVVRAEGLLVS